MLASSLNLMARPGTGMLKETQRWGEGRGNDGRLRLKWGEYPRELLSSSLQLCEMSLLIFHHV